MTTPSILMFQDSSDEDDIAPPDHLPPPVPPPSEPSNQTSPPISKNPNKPPPIPKPKSLKLQKSVIKESKNNNDFHWKEDFTEETPKMPLSPKSKQPPPPIPSKPKPKIDLNNLKIGKTGTTKIEITKKEEDEISNLTEDLQPKLENIGKKVLVLDKINNQNENMNENQNQNNNENNNENMNENMNENDNENDKMKESEGNLERKPNTTTLTNENHSHLFQNSPENTKEIKNKNAVKISQTSIKSGRTKKMNAIKEGFLEKQGHVVLNWKKRWFVLTATGLEYYEKPSSTKAKGFVDFTNGFIKVEEHIDKVENRKFCMRIILQEKEFLIDCKNNTELRGWIKSVNEIAHYYI